MSRPYVGRFAPSPTGPLHAGSLVAALASCLDARAHRGRWLLRIEDLDPPREIAGATADILALLRDFGFESDVPVVLQSQRGHHYQAAFDRLLAAGLVYPCSCTRREIADSLLRQGAQRARHHELIYPGTCRGGLAPGRAARAWRLRVDDTRIVWQDRGSPEPIDESLATSVGDFVIRRADGCWAYQLAVVVDDHLQGVTDVVRGEDLRDSTARQIHLQQRLGYQRPRYLHLPVVLSDSGEKLSKQTGAQALDPAKALPALESAMRHLGLPATGARSLDGFWPKAVDRWRESAWMSARQAGEPDQAFLPPSSAATGRAG